MQIDTATMEDGTEIPYKTRNKTTVLFIYFIYDPAIPLLGICPEQSKIEKDTCTPLFIAAIFTISRTWKQPNVH